MWVSPVDEEMMILGRAPLVVVVGKPRYLYIVPGTRILLEIHLKFRGSGGKGERNGVVKGRSTWPQHVTH